MLILISAVIPYFDFP